MFKLTFVTPNKKLLTDVEIEEVIVPSHRGQLDILPGHAPMVTTLSAGVLKVKVKGEAKFKTAAIGWGYMEVNPAGVVILADHAEWPEEIDKNIAQKNYEEATHRLQEAGLSIDEKILVQREQVLAKTRVDIFDHLH